MTKIVQNSFLGGQLDFEMMGRQDVEKYQKGATELKNFIPLRRGAIRKRAGTDFLHDVSGLCASAAARRLVPFAYTLGEGWCLLFTPGRIDAYASGQGPVRVKVKGVDAAGEGAGQMYDTSKFYAADMIPDVDFCQCGDVMFLAHQDHVPCRIEHTVAGGVHTFTIEEIDLNIRNHGIPSILGATVSKTGITTDGPIVTEYYKVTAVYDGIETFPSEAFYHTAKRIKYTINDWFANNDATRALAGCDHVERNWDYDERWDAWQLHLKAVSSLPNVVVQRTYEPGIRSRATTSYTKPWTESQKITLDISVPTRSDGKRPQQLRIYRKSGSFYGMVGFVDLGGSGGGGERDMPVDAVSLPPDSDADGDGIKYGTDAGVEAWINNPGETMHFTGACYYRQKNKTARQQTDVASNWLDYPTTEHPTLKGFHALKVSFTSRQSYVTFAIFPGTIEKSEITTGEGTAASVTSIVYTYNPWPGGSGTKRRFTVKAGRQITFMVRKADCVAQTMTVERRTGEDADDFADRAHEDMVAWLRGQALSGTLTNDSAQNVAVNGITIDCDDGGTTSTLLEETDWVGFDLAGLEISATVREEQPSTSPVAADAVQWDDVYYTPDVSLTPPRRELVMDRSGEWPACVCLSQQRLIWASTKSDPSRIIMSEVGNFDVYTPHEAMVDSDPIDFMVSATRFPKVNHLVEMRKLLLFNGDAEWVVDSASSSSGITFETIQARRHSGIGAAPRLKPIVCSNVLLFAERTGRAVRQYGYQLEDDGFGGDDISIFSAGIFRNRRIVDWAYQQHPHSTCWCVLSDGAMCSLTFMREQNTVAWATHGLGGGGKVRGIVCTHALIGADDNNRDTSQMMLLVERGGVWSIEEMRCDCRHGGHDAHHAMCMDSMRLRAAGEAVAAGAVRIDPYSGEEVDGSGQGYEGYPFESVFTSVYPVVRNAVGMAQMDIKCVQEVRLRMADAVGGKVRGIGVPDAQASALAKTGLVRQGVSGQFANIAFPDGPVDEVVPLTTDNSRDGRITLVQGEPWPFTLLMLETDLETEEAPR